MILRLLFLCTWTLSAQTAVKDQAAAAKLLGAHPITLQWITFGNENAGTVTILSDKGTYRLKGEQRGKDGDFLRIEGIVTEVQSKRFEFEGRIVTRVSHIHAGKECARDGKFSFIISGTRQYWRLLQFNNPCEEVSDYIDIFFARKQPGKR